MDIALVTHNVIRGDGQGRVNYEITRYIANQGIKVSLFADKVAPELLDYPEVTWHPVHPITQHPILFKCLDFERRANRLVKGEFDLIVANGAVFSLPHHINIVHFVHTTWLKSPYHISNQLTGPYSWYQRFFTWINAQAEKRAFARTRQLVAVSNKVKEELLESGIPAHKIQVIVNGVDPNEFFPAPTSRKELNLPEGVPLALFVGDIRTPLKNLDTILKALVDVPALHLAIAGRIQGSPAPALAEALHLTERVHFLGFRSDIPALMRAADFFVFPSRRDSCPLVVLEALASGLPVVLTQTVGMSDIIPETCSILLSDPEDKAGLSLAMKKLTSNPALRQQMSIAARRFAEHHSWTHMAKEYLNLFLQMAYSPSEVYSLS